MANPQETSVKDFDLKKEICFDSIIIKLYGVSPKTQLQVYPLKHIIS